MVICYSIFQLIIIILSAAHPLNKCLDKEYSYSFFSFCIPPILNHDTSHLLWNSMPFLSLFLILNLPFCIPFKGWWFSQILSVPYRLWEPYICKPIFHSEFYLRFVLFGITSTTTDQMGCSFVAEFQRRSVDIYIYIFFDMSAQEWENGFELVTSASLGVIPVNWVTSWKRWVLIWYMDIVLSYWKPPAAKHSGMLRFYVFHIG